MLAGKIKLYTPCVVAAARITSSFPRILVVRSGRRVELQCDGVGPPIPDVYWTNGSRRVRSSHPRTLTLERATQHNAGIYRCHAVNHLGNDVKETRIGTRCKHCMFGHW